MDALGAVLGFVFKVAAAVVSFCAGVPVGVLSAIGCYLVPLWWVGNWSTELPERIDPLTTPDGATEPAIPAYLHGPAAADAAFVRGLARLRFREVTDGWQESIDSAANPADGDGEFTAPFAYGFGAGLAVGAVPGLAIAVVIGVVHWVVVLVLGGAARLVGLILRGVDSLLLRLRNVRMRCLVCFRRMPYPAYRCPGCEQTHWDIRPGRFGILRRRCRCGRRLPTLLLLGSGGLEARCNRMTCPGELPHGPGRLPEIVIPIFGATTAGKTRLLHGLIAALQQRASRPGVDIDYPDQETRTRLEHSLAEIQRGRSTEATPPALQRGQVLELRIGRRTRFLQLFDTAGERFASNEGTDTLHFLQDGRTFVLVVDPLSVHDFWNGLNEGTQARLGGDGPAVGMPQPDRVFAQTLSRIDRPTAKASRLAIVFSRADVLEQADSQPMVDDRAWAESSGFRWLLREADSTFRTVEVFRTAAVADGDVIHPSMGRLLSWLLATPAEPEPAPEGMEATPA